MEKNLPLLAVGILILSGFGAVATSHQNLEHKTVAVDFPNLVIKPKNDYVTIEINGVNSQLIREGKPILPSYTHTFTFPLGTEIESVTCTRGKVEEETITKEIMMSPRPVALSQVLDKKDTSNPIWQDTYPDTLYEYDVGCGLIGSQRCIFVKVQVFPVEYHPQDNLIEWSDDIEINVEYSKSTQPIFFEETYELVVLTPSQFSSQLNSLVTHKNNRGIPTKLVSLNEIFAGSYFPVQGEDEPEKIKYFIKNAIENWGTTNILLVGSSSKFPTRETHVKVSNKDQEIFVSDLYYADIYDGEMEFCSWDSNGNNIFAEYDWNGKTDEVDLYPDVHIGRLACTSGTQVTTCVNKIINYETSKAYTKDWFTNLVVIGGDTVPKDDSGIDEGEYVNQAIMDIMDGFVVDKIWDSNHRLSGISPYGVTNINNGINSGCGFVDWSGHGAPTVWTTYPHNGDKQSLPTPWGIYRSSHIGDLTNGDKLPIAINGGCSIGKFNENDNCFAWAYLANPNGGGIASCGATGLGYIYVGEWATHGLIEGLTVDMFEAYDDGATTFGEMWCQAINNYISTKMSAGDYKTLEEWQPFGDPTLAIAAESLSPTKPDAPEGPESGGVGTSYTYSASTTDPDGDKISYLFDWGDGTYSNWVGPKNSGQTASASHAWSSKGSYAIRVLAKDEHGKQSGWSDPTSLSMPRSKSIQMPFLKVIEQYPILYQLLLRFFNL